MDYATAQHEAQQDEYNTHATPARLLQVFPGMESRYTAILKDRVKAHKAEREAVRHRMMQTTNALTRAPQRDRLGLELHANACQESLDELDRLIKKIAFQIASLTAKNDAQNPGNSNATPTGVSDVMIHRAKEYPISELLQVNGMGFAKCPFHAEKTASLKVYKSQNSWWCYSCAAGGDVIALVMRQDNLTFPQAVRQLSCG